MKRVQAFMSYAGAITIGCMALLTGIDVVGRYVFNKPIHGGFDLIELLMVIVVPCGIAVATAANDHIAVDSLFNKLPSLGKRILLVFSGIITTFIFAVLAWQGIYGGVDMIKAGKATAILAIPIAPFQLFLALGFLVSFIFSCMQTISLVQTLKMRGNNG